jgi:ketosteroid isomerase-like protein
MDAEHTRKVAKRFVELHEAMQILDAYGMIGENGRFILIGTTPLSGVFHGKRDFLERLGPVVQALPAPAQSTFSEIIVDGDRAVMLASGKGKAMGGRDYNQPYYAYVARVEGDGFSELIEFCDTALIEYAYFNKRLVPAEEMAASSSTN